MRGTKKYKLVVRDLDYFEKAFTIDTRYVKYKFAEEGFQKRKKLLLIVP